MYAAALRTRSRVACPIASV